MHGLSIDVRLFDYYKDEMRKEVDKAINKVNNRFAKNFEKKRLHTMKSKIDNTIMRMQCDVRDY